MTTVTGRELRGLTVTAAGEVHGPSGRKLSPFPVKGYLRVNRYSRDKWIAEPVHRLVCEAFHGPAPEGATQVRHLDGDPMNNHADNLAWGTYAENEADKAEHGRSLQGERHHQSKLTQAQVDEIRAYPAETTHSELGRKYNVDRKTVSLIRRGRTWRHGA